MIVLLYGANTMAIRRRLQQLKDEADGGSGMLATNYLSIDGRDAKPDEILGPAMSPPFLAPHRLIVVENFLQRYERRGPAARGGGGRSVDALKPLLETLEAGLPDTTILVFTMPEESQRNPLIDALKKLPGVSDEPQPELKGDALLRYIREEAAMRGIKFRPGPSRRPHPGSEEWARGPVNDPASLIATLTRGDTLAVANELDKLALFTLGRDATVDDVYEACAGDREAGEWALQDAVLEGRLKDAFETLALLRAETDFSEQGLLGQLLGIYRRYAPGVEVLDNGGSLEDFAAAMRIPPNATWRRDKDRKRVQRLLNGGLLRAYSAIVEADRRHKLGEIDDDLAIEILIGKLAAP